MRVAVNTRFMLSNEMEGYGNFIYEIFARITKQHPEHEFLYIFDQPFDEKQISENNITAIVASPSARYPLLWKYWYDIKVPALLKKWKADVFVSCDGICSLKTVVPQCLIIHDLNFLHQPPFVKKSHAAYLKKYTPEFIKKAKSVICVSAFLKQELNNRFQAENSKINVVYSGAGELFQPLMTDEKAAIKKLYTESKEYFVYAGVIHGGKNMIGLLKAFSLFKKRQQTNMKLVIAGNIDIKYESFEKDIRSYKYKEDVVLIRHFDKAELAKVIGAAYGFISPSLTEEFPVHALSAMKANIPVIALTTNSLKEIAGDAVLYTDETTHSALADKMMLLYKDERLRNDLIIKGRNPEIEFNWDKTAQLVWISIQKAIG